MYILMGIDHVLDIPRVIWASKDISRNYVLLSWSILASDPTRDVHTKIYSLNILGNIGMGETLGKKCVWWNVQYIFKHVKIVK